MTRDLAEQILSDALREKLLRNGFLLLPTHISWRRAQQLERLGWATIYPFHQRWQGRLDLTEAGRSRLKRAA